MIRRRHNSHPSHKSLGLIDFSGLGAQIVAQISLRNSQGTFSGIAGLSPHEITDCRVPDERKEEKHGHVSEAAMLNVGMLRSHSFQQSAKLCLLLFTM